MTTVKLWIPVQIKNTMERQCMGRQMGDIFSRAIQIRYTDLFNSDSTLKSNEDLTKMFEDAGLSKKRIILLLTVPEESVQLICKACNGNVWL